MELMGMWGFAIRPWMQSIRTLKNWGIGFSMLWVVVVPSLHLGSGTSLAIQCGKLRIWIYFFTNHMGTHIRRNQREKDNQSHKIKKIELQKWIIRVGFRADVYILFSKFIGLNENFFDLVRKSIGFEIITQMQTPTRNFQFFLAVELKV